MGEPEVVVVGAGPVGLMLAGDLAAHGVDVVVLERRRTLSPASRAFILHARSLELLDARGLAEELVDTGLPVHSLRLPGGTVVDMGRLVTPFPFMLSLPQPELDSRLRARAEQLGATLRRGSEVTDVRADRDGVTTMATEGQGCRLELRSRYVVGADGARSVVRTAAGIAFPGRTAIGL